MSSTFIIHSSLAQHIPQHIPQHMAGGDTWEAWKTLPEARFAGDFLASPKALEMMSSTGPTSVLAHRDLGMR